MKKLEPKTAKVKFEKPFAKKSVDWSMNISDNKHQILQPIVEEISSCKKVK